MHSHKIIHVYCVYYYNQCINKLIWHTCKSVFINSYFSTLTWSPVTKRLPELLHSSSVMRAVCVLGRTVWSPEGCVSRITSPFSQPSANTCFVGCQRSTVGWWGRSKWQLSTCSPCIWTEVKYANFVKHAITHHFHIGWILVDLTKYFFLSVLVFIIKALCLPAVSRGPHCLQSSDCLRPQPAQEALGARSTERAQHCFQGRQYGGQNTPPYPQCYCLHKREETENESWVGTPVLYIAVHDALHGFTFLYLLCSLFPL